MRVKDVVGELRSLVLAAKRGEQVGERIGKYQADLGRQLDRVRPDEPQGRVYQSSYNLVASLAAHGYSSSLEAALDALDRDAERALRQIRGDGF